MRMDSRKRNITMNGMEIELNEFFSVLPDRSRKLQELSRIINSKILLHVVAPVTITKLLVEMICR